MKKVLIVGENSYIGNSIIKWHQTYYSGYCFEKISVRNDDWRSISFSVYDIVIHVAGMVHVKECAKNWDEYERLNSIIPCEVANKAKMDGVKHFIFFSTKGVYAPNTPLITRATVPVPNKLYGKSKLEGEEKIVKLDDDRFKVSIIRPAVVYGEGCKGNFPRLIKLSKRIHFFPYNNSKRSMIYIWNLCEYIHLLMENPLRETVLYPQDAEPVGTMDIMIQLWKTRNEKYIITKIGGLIISFLLKMPGMKNIKTMFMETVYSKEISNDFNNKYCVFSFNEAIEMIIKAEAE